MMLNNSDAQRRHVGVELSANDAEGQEKSAHGTIVDFFPAALANNQLLGDVGDIIKASNDLAAELAQMRQGHDAPKRHNGQDGQGGRKLADTSTDSTHQQTLPKMATFAPSTNPAQFNMAADQLAGMEHHDTPMTSPQQWQGAPDAMQGNTAIFGHNLFNSPAMGNPQTGNFLGPGAGAGDSMGAPGGTMFKESGLNVSAVGEGDYSKLKVVPFNSYGPKVLDEIEHRMNSQAKKSPCSKLQDMDLCDDSDGEVHTLPNAQGNSGGGVKEGLAKVAATLPEGKYRLDMVKIAEMMGQGTSLSDALQSVKGIDPRHARYQAHVWEERLASDGALCSHEQNWMETLPSKVAADVNVSERASPLVHPFLTRLVYGKDELRAMTPKDQPRFQRLADYMTASSPSQLNTAALYAGRTDPSQLVKKVHEHKDYDTTLEDVMGIRDQASLQMAGITPELMSQLPAMYQPHANSAIVNEASPGVAMHELGHGVDMARRKGESNLYRWLRWNVKPRLLQELSAWRKGRKSYQKGFAASPESDDEDAMDEYGENMKSYNARKYPAYGTYLGGAAGATAGIAAPVIANLAGAIPADLLPPLIGLGGGVGGALGAIGGGGAGKLWAYMRQNAHAKKSMKQLAKLKLKPEQLEEIAARLQQIRDDRAAEGEQTEEPLQKAAAVPEWLSGMAGGLQDSFQGMDPTLKSGLVGAGVGGGVGALAGGLNRAGGGYRPAISQEMAQQLQGMGVNPAIIQKLLQPDQEGDLGPEEIQELTQAGVDYDEIAPKPGYMSNMLGGVAKGGLMGGALGGIGGAAAQELPRMLAGTQAPSAGADVASQWMPDWAPQGIKDLGSNIGRQAGKAGWSGLSRPQQFDITDNAMGGRSPSSLIDTTLDKLNPKGG